MQHQMTMHYILSKLSGTCTTAQHTTASDIHKSLQVSIEQTAEYAQENTDIQEVPAHSIANLLCKHVQAEGTSKTYVVL